MLGSGVVWEAEGACQPEDPLTQSTRLRAVHCACPCFKIYFEIPKNGVFFPFSLVVRSK